MTKMYICDYMYMNFLGFFFILFYFILGQFIRFYLISSTA